ncbi:hypothetical protein KP509_04G020200 [Ceratopteris richardii]|uniref:Phytocyanin domain-containing protein n=1 Tax=Ceratopteris richardii TaxID=49495 RepID=A0A8T2UQX7_CERRI|nr:hypothetical protein KP509_04G020200 [Ceratopteris richardii]
MLLHIHNDPICRRFLRLIIIIFMAFFCSCTQVVFATKHTVGGSQGWNLGVDYETWSSSTNFHEGDTLYFKYQAEAHNVWVVNQNDYNTCSVTKPISKDDGNGSTTITLTTAGDSFYICGIPGHCASGMKLHVFTRIGKSGTSKSPGTSNSKGNSTTGSSSASSSLRTTHSIHGYRLKLLLLPLVVAIASAFS